MSNQQKYKIGERVLCSIWEKQRQLHRFGTIKGSHHFDDGLKYCVETQHGCAWMLTRQLTPLGEVNGNQ